MSNSKKILIKKGVIIFLPKNLVPQKSNESGTDDEPPLTKRFIQTFIQKMQISKIKNKIKKINKDNIKQYIKQTKQHLPKNIRKLIQTPLGAKKIKNIGIVLWTILLKLNKKRFATLTIVFVLSLAILSTSRAATNSTVYKNEAISGNSDSINNTIKDINGYIPQIKDSGIKFEIENKKADYAIKPQITNTESREEKDRIEKQKRLAQTRRNVLIRERNTRRYNDYSTISYSDKNHNFNTYAFGYCTWYAAQRRSDIPNRLGNGGSWYYNAQRNGIPTGKNPKTGAIIVTRESWAGHVGYVESVDGNQIRISEMNYRGWNRVTTRTIDKNSSIIKGYIY